MIAKCIALTFAGTVAWFMIALVYGTIMIDPLPKSSKLTWFDILMIFPFWITGCTDKEQDRMDL